MCLSLGRGNRPGERFASALLACGVQRVTACGHVVLTGFIVRLFLWTRQVHVGEYLGLTVLMGGKAALPV